MRYPASQAPHRNEITSITTADHVVPGYEDATNEEMLRAFFNANADDYMAYWDSALNLKLANFNLSPEFMPHIAKVRDEKTALKFEAEQDGRTFLFGVYPALGTFGDCLGVAVFAHDISRAKESEREVHRLANYDPLTGLPNRALLNDRLTQALLSALRREHFGAVVYIDLDRFRTVNESLGQQAGDHVLRLTADRLKACRRDEDTTARVCSDEFVWVLPELSNNPNLAARFAGRAAERFLTSFQAPTIVDGTELRISPSVGITVFGDTDASHEAIVAQANAAMERAKEIGAAPIQHYRSQMHESAMERLRVETRLHDAVQNKKLEVYYQPQAHCATNSLVGAEALLRWDDELLGPVSPAQFIPIAEETGLILEIGDFVLSQVCQQLNVFNSRYGDGALARIAVNISPLQFHAAAFVDQVADAMRRWNIQPNQLELELTEGIVVENVESTIEKMRALKALGARIAIDDFGTGYSSLAYLNRMPLDIVKIDQSFIRDIGETSTSHSIITSIITMAQLLGFDIVAEGVETNEHLAFLRERDCPTYQGFGYCRPLESAQFADFVDTQFQSVVAAE